MMQSKWGGIQQTVKDSSESIVETSKEQPDKLDDLITSFVDGMSGEPELVSRMIAHAAAALPKEEQAKHVAHIAATLPKEELGKLLTQLQEQLKAQ